MSDIAELCAWLRECSGLSRTEFARQAGVSRYSTLHWEKDQAAIPLATFLDLCHVADVSPVEAIRRLTGAAHQPDGKPITL